MGAMHWEVACCAMETVTVVCTVYGPSSQAIQRMPLQALGSKQQSNWPVSTLSSPVLLEKIGMKDCVVTLLSVVCMTY